MLHSPVSLRRIDIWLTSRSTLELQIYLTKHGGSMVRRMLTSLYNSFACLSPLWTSSRRTVWFGLQSSHVEVIDISE